MKLYPVQEALKLIKDNATAKFNESVDVSINLGIDAKKSDQAVRGSIVLPQGTGKSVRVAVFAQGDRAASKRGTRVPMSSDSMILPTTSKLASWISTW
jgi:large subunit ribosomal protein L1